MTSADSECLQSAITIEKSLSTETEPHETEPTSMARGHNYAKPFFMKGPPLKRRDQTIVLKQLFDKRRRKTLVYFFIINKGFIALLLSLLGLYYSSDI